MIYLKSLSEHEIAHLIKKGGMLVHSMNWKKTWQRRYLVVKRRKQRHFLNYDLKLLETKTLITGDWSTEKLWRFRSCWAYIPSGEK